MAQPPTGVPPQQPVPPPAPPYPYPYPYYAPPPPRPSDTGIAIIVIVAIVAIIVVAIILVAVFFFAFLGSFIPRFPTQRPTVAFGTPGTGAGNVSVPVASVSQRQAGALFEASLIWNANASTVVDMQEFPGYELALVSGTSFRISWLDNDGGALLSTGDQFRVSGDGVPLPAGSYTLVLFWRLDSSVLAQADWTV